LPRHRRLPDFGLVGEENIDMFAVFGEGLNSSAQEMMRGLPNVGRRMVCAA
jgi:hypothetical protein